MFSNTLVNCNKFEIKLIIKYRVTFKLLFRYNKNISFRLNSLTLIIRYLIMLILTFKTFNVIFMLFKLIYNINYLRLRYDS